MVKKVFENSKFSTLKIACKNFRPKNFEFSKTVLTIQFRRLWKMFLARVQKFSEISKKNVRTLLKGFISRDFLKQFSKKHKFLLKSHFFWKRDDFELGRMRRVVETRLIRSEIFCSIRKILCQVFAFRRKNCPGETLTIPPDGPDLSRFPAILKSYKIWWFRCVSSQRGSAGVRLRRYYR